MSTENTKKSNKNWKKVLQIVPAYLVAAWTFLQFVDWILVRYQISPYWVDILLWLFVGILPSLIIYLFNSDRINKKRLELKEKIIFPANILVLGVFLFLFFGNSDLGSTTKEISFTNEIGTVETQTITKQEFRIGVPIFNFKQIKKDTLNDWLGKTINQLIKIDLDQDKDIDPSISYADNTTDKVKISSIFDKLYVDGEYKVSGDIYTITPIIRNSKNGKEISQKTFSGKDFFSLIDEISIYIKNNVGLIGDITNQYIDLEIKDIMTNSVEALELWAKEDYEGAVTIDSTFALAYFDNAERRTRYSQGELEEKYLIDKAYQNKSKLPSQLQFKILMYKNIVYERWEDAKELIKYQLEFEPNNESFNYLLDIIYSETQDIDAYYEHSFEQFTKNRNEETAKNYFMALIYKNEFKKAINLVKTFELLAPNVEDVQLVKAYTYLAMDNFEEAKKTYKKIDLVWPKETHYKTTAYEYIKNKKENSAVKINTDIFENVFRSVIGEQEIKYFKKENNLFIHYKNQFLKNAFVFDKNELLSLNPGYHSGIKHIFEKDKNGNIYRVTSEQFNLQNVSNFYYYLESDEIRKAYGLLKKKELKDLGVTFEELIQKHPKHWFLKDGYNHIKYINSKSKKELKNQYEKIIGNYANRKFWVEKDRLFYKRQGLTKVEIFPISNKRYISLSKYGTNYEFDFLKDGKVASFAWTYNVEKEAWEKLDNEANYLFKD
tara:strand:- start:11334 stop:13493 length:2160 start_codon:yes stop_codon:yes gene_type:complete